MPSLRLKFRLFSLIWILLVVASAVSGQDHQDVAAGSQNRQDALSPGTGTRFDSTGVQMEVTTKTYDTISNWDGKSKDWTVWAGGSEVVTNPYSFGINTSAHCFKVVTTSDPYDLFFYVMDESANFDQYPRYKLKVYAPPGGGKVTMKFENSTVTQWFEITKTVAGSQWTDLEFDFSGASYNGLSRMVIFFDFQGVIPGKTWYFDDVMKEIPPPLTLHTTLPIVVINTFGVSIPDDPKIDGHMGVVDHGEGSLNTLGDSFNGYDGNIGIEIRGNSSQLFPKKAYGLETRDAQGQNLDVPLLGFPKENDWVFYASYSDKSFLRNVFTFNLARKTSGYHSRTRFCELVLNNNYKGVYVLMEKIKRDKNRVNIASLDPDEIAGDDLTGGYILSVDKTDYNFVLGVHGFRSHATPTYPNAKDIIFQYYYPEADVIVAEQRNYIRNFIETAQNTLTKTGFSNPYDGYQKYFDTPSFVDFMLVNEISKEVDKYRYSSYFYKMKDSDGGKLFAGPVWDFDLGYGNVNFWSPGIDPTGWRYSMVTTGEYSIIFWWKRLMEDAYFRDLAKTRWTELRQGDFSDASVTALIDSITGSLGTAKDRNFERWPILGTYVWPNYNWQNNDYEDEVAYFKSFLFTRLHWIDANLPGKVLQPWASISASGNQIRLKLFGDYFCRPNLKPGDFTINNGPGTMTVTAVNFLDASECILYVSSGVASHPDISVTAHEDILNWYHDLTSNRLITAGFDDGGSLPAISVTTRDGGIQILCDKPELLNGQVVIRNVAGQNMGSFTVGSTNVQLIPVSLAPGLYLLTFDTKPRPTVVKLIWR